MRFVLCGGVQDKSRRAHGQGIPGGDIPFVIYGAMGWRGLAHDRNVLVIQRLAAVLPSDMDTLDHAFSTLDEPKADRSDLRKRSVRGEDLVSDVRAHIDGVSSKLRFRRQRRAGGRAGAQVHEIGGRAGHGERIESDALRKQPPPGGHHPGEKLRPSRSCEPERRNAEYLASRWS